MFTKLVLYKNKKAVHKKYIAIYNIMSLRVEKYKIKQIKTEIELLKHCIITI